VSPVCLRGLQAAGGSGRREPREENEVTKSIQFLVGNITNRTERGLAAFGTGSGGGGGSQSGGSNKPKPGKDDGAKPAETRSDSAARTD